MLSEEEKIILMQEGFQVVEKPTFDPHFRTKTFIRFPDGRLVPHYQYMFEIPSSLNDGDEISMSRTAIPLEIRDTNNIGTALWGFSSKGDLVEAPALYAWVMWVVWAIISVIIIYGVIQIINAIRNPPCGTKPYTEWMNDCWKVVIMPNCDYREFNSCADPDGDGVPEGEWGGPWKSGAFGIPWTLVIGGIIAIGGIFILYKFLESREKKRYLAAYEKYPERMAPPPPLREPLPSRVAESIYGAGREAYRGVRRRL